uniref:N/A n=1 Tax=Ganoderma boninense TaxID=34458 RepID=A0A5K1K3E7_9APHY|nr:N/A [Ganoderma boninense]
MLLKVTSPDIHNTALLDCATNEVLYRTTTSPVPPGLSPGPSRSRTSLASSNRSYEKLPACDLHTTAVLDPDGDTVAEIVWEGHNATIIRIQDEELRGTTELFDAAFARVLPDETILPTRMEYTWRITAEGLTVRAVLSACVAAPIGSLMVPRLASLRHAQLVDDDDEVVGRLYSDCSLINGRPVPALPRQPGSAKRADYIELENLPSDELLEVIGMSYSARPAPGTNDLTGAGDR